jgi:hypothetical protein
MSQVRRIFRIHHNAEGRNVTQHPGYCILTLADNPVVPAVSILFHLMHNFPIGYIRRFLKHLL